MAGWLAGWIYHVLHPRETVKDTSPSERTFGLDSERGLPTQVPGDRNKQEQLEDHQTGGQANVLGSLAGAHSAP